MLLSAHGMAGEHSQMFPYSILYKQLKLNTTHHDAKVSFFMVHPASHQTCTILSAWLEDKNHRQTPIKITAENELQLPISSQWQRQKPAIVVKTQSTESCHINLSVRNKRAYTHSISYQELLALNKDMQKLMIELGHAVPGWKAPPLKGLILEFEPTSATRKATLETKSGKTFTILNHKANVSLSDLKPGDIIQFPAKLRAIIPAI